MDATVRPMRRSQSLLLVIVLILGLVIGFFLRGWPQPAVVPVTNDLTAPPEQPVAASELTGWCCPAGASSCSQSVTAVECLRGGGQIFHREQNRCDAVCAFLSSR
jgi:hypothetical protein